MLRVDFTGSVGAVTCSKESDLAFTTGMVGKKLLVRFNEEWEGLEVLISFWNDVDKMTIEIGTAPVNEYLEVAVPWEILLNENKPLKIGAYGYTVDGQYIVTAIPTIWELLGYIRRGSDGNGQETGPDPTVHIGSDDVVAIANGGTAARTAEEARRKLGITFENIIGEGSGVVPIAKGGTGGTNAKDALFGLHAWDLDEGKELDSGTDLDDVVEIGTYHCAHENIATISNTPFETDTAIDPAGFKMMVNEFGTGAKFQVVFASKNRPAVYVRSYGDGEWHDWVKLITQQQADETYVSLIPKIVSEWAAQKVATLKFEGHNVYPDYKFPIRVDLAANVSLRDLNNVIDCGFYKVASRNDVQNYISNSPTATAFILDVYSINGADSQSSDYIYREQKLVNVLGEVWRRHRARVGDSWTPWINETGSHYETLMMANRETNCVLNSIYRRNGNTDEKILKYSVPGVAELCSASTNTAASRANINKLQYSGFYKGSSAGGSSLAQEGKYTLDGDIPFGYFFLININYGYYGGVQIAFNYAGDGIKYRRNNGNNVTSWDSYANNWLPWKTITIS